MTTVRTTGTKMNARRLHRNGTFHGNHKNKPMGSGQDEGMRTVRIDLDRCEDSTTTTTAARWATSTDEDDSPKDEATGHGPTRHWRHGTGRLHAAATPTSRDTADSSSGGQRRL